MIGSPFAAAVLAHDGPLTCSVPIINPNPNVSAQRIIFHERRTQTHNAASNVNLAGQFTFTLPEQPANRGVFDPTEPYLQCTGLSWTDPRKI